MPTQLFLYCCCLYCVCMSCACEPIVDDPSPDPIRMIDSGEFMMGFPEEYQYYNPPHAVYLSSFSVDSFLVSNDRFVTFLNTQGNIGSGVVYLNPQFSRIYYDGQRWSVTLGYERHPVVGVSWYGSSDYCLYHGGRLPTEAEWERSARGSCVGSVCVPLEKLPSYPWGDDPPDCGLSNFYDILGTGEPCVNDTTPIDWYPDGVSIDGIYDMAGNVWQWCSDWWDGEYYTYSPSSNPQGPPTGPGKVIRGGSYLHDDEWITSYNRYVADPSTTAFTVGFRCVYDVESNRWEGLRN